MKIYFLSSKPCALTLNGVFFGVTDDFERFAEISLSDGVFAQFCPQGAQPLGLFLTEKLLKEPPEGVEVYLLKEGIALYARDFTSNDFSLRPLAQKRAGDVLATAFVQGKPQLHVESPKGYFNATLPPSFDPCTLSLHGDFILLKGEETLGVFNLQAKPLLVEKVIDYELTENALSATLPLSDSRRRTAKCKWTLTEETCTLSEFALRQSPAEGEEFPPKDLLAYAFFESVLLQADCAPFLSDELLADLPRIRAFLGDFIAVTLTQEPTSCGLVRKMGERLFALDYFSVEICDGKIVDVHS